MTKALLVVGMQQYVETQIKNGRDHFYPNALSNIPPLIEAFREASLDIIHVLHSDAEPHQDLHPHTEGYVPIHETQAMDDEHVFVKTTRSMFDSTDIKNFLKDKGISELYVVGADLYSSILHSIPTAVDLGIESFIVSDCVVGFDFHDRGIAAEQAYNLSLACLEADGARVTQKEVVLELIGNNEALQD